MSSGGPWFSMSVIKCAEKENPSKDLMSNLGGKISQSQSASSLQMRRNSNQSTSAASLQSKRARFIRKKSETSIR